MTVGTVLAGTLHRVVCTHLAAASVQSAFIASGFAVLTYSLYAGEETERDDGDP